MKSLENSINESLSSLLQTKFKSRFDNSQKPDEEQKPEVDERNIRMSFAHIKRILLDAFKKHNIQVINGKHIPSDDRLAIWKDSLSDQRGNVVSYTLCYNLSDPHDNHAGYHGYDYKKDSLRLVFELWRDADGDTHYRIPDFILFLPETKHYGYNITDIYKRFNSYKCRKLYSDKITNHIESIVGRFVSNVNLAHRLYDNAYDKGETLGKQDFNKIVSSMFKGMLVDL